MTVLISAASREDRRHADVACGRRPIVPGAVLAPWRMGLPGHRAHRPTPAVREFVDPAEVKPDNGASGPRPPDHWMLTSFSAGVLNRPLRARSRFELCSTQARIRTRRSRN